MHKDIRQMVAPLLSDYEQAEGGHDESSSFVLCNNGVAAQSMNTLELQVDVNYLADTTRSGMEKLNYLFSQIDAAIETMTDQPIICGKNETFQEFKKDHYQEYGPKCICGSVMEDKIHDEEAGPAAAKKKSK